MSTNTLPPEMITQITTGNDEHIVAFFRKIRDEHGDEWLAAIKREYPSAARVADLVANKTADEAFAEIRKEYGWAAGLIETQLKALHAKLRHEIEVKR